MQITKTVFFIVAGFCLLLCNSCKNKNPTLFESLLSSKTNITFTNKLEKHKMFNILYYLYYYNGGGVATGDINKDGLPDIYFTANKKGGNKLYLNKGNFTFEDITEEAGVAGKADWSTGVTMADINADGFLDIYVSTVSGKYDLKGYNELYINNGNNTFSEKAEQYGLNTSCLTTQSAFFDYDRDGDLDLIVVRQNSPAALLRNDSQLGHGLRVAVVGRTSNRSGFNVKVNVTCGDEQLRGEFAGGTSFAAAHERLLCFGLGEMDARCLIEVHWPSGVVDKISIDHPDRLVTVVEGLGQLGHQRVAEES